MNDALNIFYYTMNKFWEFVFGAYVFDGVSIGMLFVVYTIFVVLLRFLLAIPKIDVPDHRDTETFTLSESKVYTDKGEKTTLSKTHTKSARRRV